MANGTRIRDLLMAERDGKLSDQERTDIATLRQAGKFPKPLAQEMSGRDLLAKGIMGSGFGTQPYTTPETSVMPGAFVARTAPGLIPNPALSSAASVAGEGIAQAAEMGVGARKEFDPTQMAVAGAVPPVVAGAVRLARGVGRTVTRVMPSAFRSAQEKAVGAAAQTAQGLASDVNPGQLFNAARAAGAESIPMAQTAKVLDEVGRSIPASPASPALKTVREFIDNTSGAINGGQMSLESLMALRRDLGASLGRAPELKAIYGGLIGDLKSAAQAGGPGASMAAEALTAFKKDLGVQRFSDLVEAATSRRAIAGADTPILNMSKLANAFAKDSKEFADLLGPDGMQAVAAFIQRFRSLPPENAFNGWNMMLASLFGGAGFVGAGAPAAAGAAIGQELIRNAAAVGKNPAALNQYMNTLVQAARQAAPAMEAP